MTARKVALVTGASTGIGRAIASRLADAGYMVYGTSRNCAKVQPLPGVTFLPLDVTDDSSVRSCVEAVAGQAGRLDLLVNNAGAAVMGGVEEVPIALAQQQFDTNFFGVVRMIQAALPVMRRQRSGTIINLSSVVGILPIPFGGFYSASKFAVEGLTEALRAEVQGLGIRVAMVEPGFFQSELFKDTADHGRIEDYDSVRARVFSKLREEEAAAPPPIAVAELVSRLAGEASPRLRNVIGKEKIFTILKRLLPERWFEPQGWKHWRVTA